MYIIKFAHLFGSLWLLLNTQLVGAEPCHLDTESKWFKPSFAHAAAIVVHGLNNKPHIMDEMSELLASKGVATLRLALEGHHGDVERQKQVKADDWLSNLRNTECALKSEYPQLPYLFVGYSLGAPLVLALEDHSKAAFFGSYVFLAPALGLNCRACVLRLLLPFKYLGVSLPSLAPEQYRAADTTSLAAYSATFDLIDSVERLSLPEMFQNIPGLMVINPKDEMVSVPQTRRWLSMNQLYHWNILEVDSKTELPKHLLVDEKSFGPESWKLFSNALDGVINELKRSGKSKE